MKFENFQHILEKNKKSNFIKIHVVGVGRPDRQTDRQTDMAKIIFALRTSVKAPKNCVVNTVESYRTASSNM